MKQGWRDKISKDFILEDVCFKTKGAESVEVKLTPLGNSPQEIKTVSAKLKSKNSQKPQTFPKSLHAWTSEFMISLKYCYCFLFC